MSPSIRTITRISKTPALFLVVALAVLFAQIGGRAQTVDPLSYGGGILINGNYVTGAVDLTSQANPPDANGLSTGVIHITGVPVDADIVSAYLVWEALAFTATPGQNSAQFRGHSLLLDDAAAVAKTHEDLVGNLSTCWTSGQPVTMWRFRADVLRFLPVRMDKDNKPTTKHLVNDADLTANGLPLHTITMPTRNGNQLPESAGATLVIVYRDPAQPLRKIVFYDGVHIQSLTESVSQTLRGFYKSVNKGPGSAKITHLLGSGQPNNNERIFFNDATETLISPPNPAFGGSSSERAWSTLTYEVTNLMTPGNNSGGGFGETASTRIDHAGGGGNDCLTWEGVIFSTAVADADPNIDGGAPGDGLPDGLEDAVSGLTDPDGTPLPNLNAMGASSTHRDLFIEVNTMQSQTTNVHGSASAPYDTSVSPAIVQIPVPPHTHMPTPDVIKSIGDAYATHGIVAHFDVGDINSYHALGVVPHTDWIDDYTSTAAESYLVQLGARGGEVIEERACANGNAQCQFPDYPGTVGWKIGLQAYRDAAVRDGGEELTLQELSDPSNPNYFDWNAGSHRRRFDRNRIGLFHYLLYAHYGGQPKSLQPCLVNGQPGPYDVNGMSCTTNNPEFHIPSSVSGTADVPGTNAMVTLGRWDEFVGRPFVRSSTTFHELGHNLNLSHGGRPTIWGNKVLNTATIVEPTCKANYISSMSYAFQVHGLFDDNDEIHFDYSNAAENNVGEITSQGDAPLSPLPLYRTAWYAPADSALAASLGVPTATRFCGGLKFDPNAPPSPMARVFNALVGDSIDWNGNKSTDAANANQDVNFDGKLTGTLFGFNDWQSLRLDQLNADRTLKVFGLGLAQDVGSGLMIDVGSGLAQDVGSGLAQDVGSGLALDVGSGLMIDVGSGLALDVGSGLAQDVGSGIAIDVGSGLAQDVGSGSQQEIDLDVAKGARGAPYALKACVIGAPGCTSKPEFDPQYHARELRWNSPPFGKVALSRISRKRGNQGSAFPFVDPVPTATSTTTTFVDVEQLPNGVPFTYRTRAQFDDGVQSGFSKTATITAVNAAPVANADPNYTTTKNKPLSVTNPAQGVLANDTDVDSPSSIIRAVLVTGPANGTLTLNANGTFTYNPKNGFSGVDTFKYKANDGPWSGDATVPLSGDSATVTVTITVTK